jgi:K+-transporting ATPase ATPase A chain
MILIVLWQNAKSRAVPGLAVAPVVPAGLSGLNNTSLRGFSEIRYAYTSAAATNGSACAGPDANSPLHNLTLAAVMFVGRFLVIVPVLCIAGALAATRVIPASAGILPTHGMQFVGLMVGTIVIAGGLAFLPALASGPAAEQFTMLAAAVSQTGLRRHVPIRGPDSGRT